jgi:TetR/AcrR family tetracycline transcriptional repressor
MGEATRKSSAKPGGPRLSRELVVATALDQIDRQGPAGLSMRSLAQELNVEAMSLYRYVHGKEDLLEGVVASLMADLTSHLEEAEGMHWQEFLQSVAHAVRKIATEHPKAFPLVATRHPAAPWLRPPLRSVEVVDTFLRSLTRSGFTDALAVDAYRAFSSFLLGQLLLQSVVHGAEAGPAEEPLDEGGAVVPEGDGSMSLDAAPEVRRLRALLSEDRSDEEFEVSLEALLDRIARDVSQ